jgi:L-lactate dehydrogenase
MSNDPVCGMRVDEKKTVHQCQHEGKTYYFCSSRCKHTFEQNPGEHLNVCRHRRTDRTKVVIVGAGEVGSTFAYALMINGLATDIVLIDQDRRRAEGHVMDLNHCLSFVRPAKITAGDYGDCQDASLVVVTAGAAQKPGETRLDLVRKNTDIFKDIIPQIAKHNPHILLIVANPVDILTYVALKLSGYSMNRVIGSGTTLDTARFRYLLSQHCGVDARNVHAYILGEHGDSEVPIWSGANIGTVSLAQYCPACERHCREDERDRIFDQVKNAAYEIIERKGATGFAIGLALVRIAETIIRNENSVLTVSSLIDGYYGIDDVCLSVPAIVNQNGIAQVLTVDLSKSEKERLQYSASVLKDLIKELEF